jgi:site-specific DNA-methyltransferase (adenine-specific)
MLDLRIPNYQIHHGNNLDILKNIPSDSIDSIVTDPPYEIAFMGKGWDNTGQAYNQELWSECLRVLKPGGHLIAFGATRTIHRTTSAIEDAGFEIRDMISWLYFSGFPKSHNLSKAIDKHFGAEREVIGKHKNPAGNKKGGCSLNMSVVGMPQNVSITAPSTVEAKEFEGWGTALKPAQEPAILARKPLSESSIARQVLKTKTGGLNIDGCRFGYGDECWVGPQEKTGNRTVAGWQTGGFVGGELINNVGFSEHSLGRWPANIYQCPKPSRAERDAGLEHLKGDIKNIHPTVKPLKLMRWLCRLVTPEGGTVLDPFTGSGSTLAGAMLEGFDCIGCELTEDYIPIIKGRCRWAIDEINGYHKRMKNYIIQPWRNHIQRIHDVLCVPGALYVGHNIQFDLHWLNYWFEKASLPPIPIRGIDTITLAHEHLTPCGLYGLSFDKIRKFLGWERREYHDALNDCRDVKRLYRTLTRATMFDRLVWRWRGLCIFRF